MSIHPRTQAEKSRVPAKWYIIKRVLESGLIKIPILGSGDMFSVVDINKFLNFTKANGVIIARGAIHNPAIFVHKKDMINFKDTQLDETEEWKNNFEEVKVTTIS